MSLLSTGDVSGQSCTSFEDSYVQIMLCVHCVTVYTDDDDDDDDDHKMALVIERKSTQC